MSEALKAWQHEIDAVKAKIIEQKVPTKYAKGLATLCVLTYNCEAGDAIAALILDSALRSDPKLLDEFDEEAGIEKGHGLDRFRVAHIRDAFGKKYQVFRALNQAGITCDLEDCLERVK
jgi:hypothetical protein